MDSAPMDSYDDRRSGSYRSDDRDRRGPPPSRRDDYDYDRSRTSSRRDYDEPPRRSSSYRDEPPRRDDRDRYGGGGRRDDDRYGGGYGGGRDRYDDRRDYGSRGRRDERPAYDEPPRRRSPTPEGAIPLSQWKREKTLWDVAAPGCEKMTALQAKQQGLFAAPGPNRQHGPQYVLGPDGTPVPLNPVPGMGPGFVPRLGGGGGGGYGSGPGPSGPMGPGFGPGGGHGGPGGGGGGGGGGPPGSSANIARQRRRLYVGGITYDCSQQGMRDVFNERMASIGVGKDEAGQDPCIDVQVNHEKGFGFVEFRSSVEATQALIFDNLSYANTILKIRRPKDYVPDENEQQGAPHIPGHVSSQVPDSPNKIFIGGLPSYLNDDQVMELLKSFGELKAFNLVKENNDPERSKGFAFCEYVDPEMTEIAIQGLHAMELGDRQLVVQRASIGSGGNAGGMRPGGGPSGSNATPGGGGLGPVPAFAQQSGPITSRAIVMLNMVTPEELTNDDDYDDILLDIRDECSKYGEVEELRIPRPAKQARKVAGQLAQAAASAADAQKSDEDAGVGRVFVLFRTLEGAQAGVQAIAGRQFGGRVIICAALDEAEFQQKRIGDTDVVEPAPAGEAPESPPRDYDQ